jgi:hypothetical protein
MNENGNFCNGFIPGRVKVTFGRDMNGSIFSGSPAPNEINHRGFLSISIVSLLLYCQMLDSGLPHCR